MNVLRSFSGAAGLALAVLAGCQSQPPAAPARSAAIPVRTADFTMTIDPVTGSVTQDVRGLWAGEAPRVRDGLLTNPPATIELWSDAGFVIGGGGWGDCTAASTSTKTMLYLKNFATERLASAWVVFTDISPAGHTPCWTQANFVPPGEIASRFPVGTRSINHGPLAGALTDATQGGAGVSSSNDIWDGLTVGARGMNWDFGYTVREPFTLTGQVWVVPVPEPASNVAVAVVDWAGVATTVAQWTKVVDSGFVATVVQVCPTAAPCGTDWGGTPVAEVRLEEQFCEFQKCGVWNGTLGRREYEAQLPILPSGTYHVFVFTEFMNAATPTPALVRGVYHSAPATYVVP